MFFTNKIIRKLLKITQLFFIFTFFIIMDMSFKMVGEDDHLIKPKGMRIHLIV